MTTGEKLQSLRKQNNYTQEELADIMNVSRQSISKWESDIAFPETEKLIALAKLYNCSIDYILNNENDDPICGIIKQKENKAYNKNPNQNFNSMFYRRIKNILFTMTICTITKFLNFKRLFFLFLKNYIKKKSNKQCTHKFYTKHLKNKFCRNTFW